LKIAALILDEWLLGNGKPGSTCTWKKKNISFNDGGMFVPNFGASNDLRPIKY